MAQSNTLEFILKLTDQASKDLQGFAKNVEGVTKGLSETGEGLIKLGAAGAAGLALATKASMDFDTQLRNVQSISKVTEEEIQAMGDTFVRLSKELPQTATQLAEGFYNIQGSGFAGSDAMMVLDAAARAASAGLTTTEASAYAITSALNAYGMGADQAKAVSDTLFKTVDIGVVSFEQLSGTIGDVLGTAANMTVGIDEVGAAIATMTKKGINASESVTAINAAILAFMKPSEGMEQTLQSLGYESGQAALEQMNLGEAMMAVLTEGEKTGVSVNDLFGNVRALKAVLALTGDDAVGFSEDLKAMQGATEGAGATQAAFAEQAKGAAFQAQIFQNNITAIGLSLRTTLLPAINDLMAKIIPVVQKFADFASQHPKLITGILGIGAGMVALGTGLVIIGQVVGAFANIANGVGVLLKVVPSVVTALGTIKTAVMGLTTFMMANPIFLVIAAIVAAIAFLALAWKNNWFDIQGKTAAVLSWIGDRFNQAKETITNFVNTVGKQIQNVGKFFERLGMTFEAIKNAILFGDEGVEGVPFFSGIINGIEQAHESIVGFFSWFGTVLQGFWDLIVNRDFTGEFGRALGLDEDSPIIGIILTIRDVVAGFIEWYVAIWRAVAAIVTGVMSVIGAIIFNTFSFIAAFLTAIMLTIWDGLMVVWNAIVLAITAVMEVLKMVISLAWQAIVLAIQTYVTPIISWLTAVWSQFSAWLTALYNQIVAMITAAWNNIKTTITNIVNPMIAWVQEKWNQLKTFIQQAHDAIRDTVTTAWNNIKSTITSLVQQALDPVQQRWNAFKENLISGAQQLWDKIVEMANGIKSALQSIKFPRLSIGEGSVSVGGHEVKYPKINVDWYKNGGWVDNTGLAVVHQGEFVLSKNMLDGKQPIPGNISNTNNTYSQPVYVTAIVNNQMDVVQMAHLIGYELNGGRY